MEERKYKVKCLQISGRGNRVYNSGDIVCESQLNWPGEDLVKRGEIEYMDGQEAESAKPEKEEIQDQEPAAEPTPLFVVTMNGEQVEVFGEETLNKKEIVHVLEKEMGIDVDTSKNKATLFGILQDQFKD